MLRRLVDEPAQYAVKSEEALRAELRDRLAAGGPEALAVLTLIRSEKLMSVQSIQGFCREAFTVAAIGEVGSARINAIAAQREAAGGAKVAPLQLGVAKIDPKILSAIESDGDGLFESFLSARREGLVSSLRALDAMGA